MKYKKCTFCLKNKIFTSFYKKKGGKLGLDSKCKSCVSLYHKQHFQKNKNKILKNRSNYSKEYRLNNKYHISEYNRNYYSKNRKRILKHKASPEYREYQNKYEKEKRKNNISYRISGSIRSRINIALRKGKGTKNNNIESLLGCNIDFLKKYIAKKFTKGMSWDNYGLYGWHIDHIKPCSSFDLTKPEQQKLCFHYSNLQPLWAKDNISKSNKY